MWSSSSSSPPSKKSKTESEIMMNNNRMNQGGSMQPPPPPPPPNNKFKFNAKPANMAPPQQPYRGGASNPSNTNQNRGQISGQRGHAADKKEAQEDEDLLDISDTELIRASQVVESQLKFINNAHTTTNNAMNIFSQFSQTTTTQQQQQLHYHHHTQHHEGGGNQYATNSRQQNNQPMPSTYSANHGAIMSTNPNYYADLTDEDIRSEILRLRNENLQKEGEVKILRDKLKKVEQDSQRMRTERLEFMKRISQQQEETSKAMQKQIEFKELENQFKSQEIVELTMKYKVLESSFKRNNNSQQPQQQITQQQQILQRPKSSTATKRHLDSMVTDGSASDTENDNPSFEVKRPMLAMNVSTSSSAMAAKPAVVAPPINRAPLSTSNITNNNQSCVYNKSLMNSSGSVSKFAQMKNESTTSMCAKIGPIKQASVTMIDESMMSFRPVPPQPRKRSCVLSSKLTRPGIISPSLSSPNELVYIITDQLAETTNYLNKFLNSDDTLLAKTRSNTIGVSKKLSELNELMDRTSSFESSSSSSGQILLKSLSNQVDRIEFVSNRLNEELKKLLDLALRTISTGVLNDESSSESSGDEEFSSSTASSSGLLKAFIDLLCVAFELSFNLFLFRVNYLYASSSVQQIDQLKNEFFTLTYHILDSIDYYPFTNATNNVKIMMGQNSMSRTASSSSAPNSSHSSYSTLKILTTTLHCFNRLLYLPCLSETMHSTSAPLLISLADNVHAISKSPLNLLDAKDTAPTSDAENEQHDNDFSCLYHFFYYKIITFFSEVVFSLDSNDSSHNKNNETNSGSSQQQMQIITTIGEESGDGLKIKNFKLDKPNNTTTTETRASTPTTPFIDTNMDLTSQLDSANNKTLTSTNQSSSQPTATTTSSTTNSTVNVDLINMNEINALKIELLVKFAYYVHNVQLFEALVTNRSKRKSTVAYTCRCACSNDMIYCYLVLVDYVFNEKMVFNASRSMLDEYLRRLSRPKSNYLFETRANKVVSTLALRDESATSQKLGRTCAIYEEKSQYSKMEESLLKLKLTEDEGVISFMNILIVNSFNTLIALLNTPNKCENSECQSAHEIEMRRQRVDYLESIRSDYRLINLSCLYKLAELNLDNSILPTTHFATSLNSLRALLKGFIDDSIDEDSSI